MTKLPKPHLHTEILLPIVPKSKKEIEKIARRMAKIGEEGRSIREEGEIKEISRLCVNMDYPETDILLHFQSKINELVEAVNALLRKVEILAEER